MWKKRDEATSLEEVVLRNLKEEDINVVLNDQTEYRIKDIDRVVAFLKNAATKPETKVNIFGDYDVDGVTSTSILDRLLTEMKINHTCRLPRRFSEGYGIKESSIDEMDGNVLITVDNGISGVDAIKKAKEKGMYVIIIDHHLAPENGIFPDADIIIDPNAVPGQADFDGYCGAGLAYKLAEAILGTHHPVMDKLASFAALGTVADVMDLVKDNRKILLRGLKALATYYGRTTGISGLMDAFELRKVTAEDIGFKLGPAINAPGRMLDNGATVSFEAISFDGDINEAKELGKNLQEINEQRKLHVKIQMEAAKTVIEDECLFSDNPLIIYHPSFSEGLIGIIAGRLVEEYGVPTFVFTDSTNPDVLKGSARSPEGVHLKNLMDTHADLFVKYGGHAAAAGMSVERSKLDDLRCALMDELADVEVTTTKDDDFYYDLEINPSEIIETWEKMEKYEPFGNGNPKPVFLIRNFKLFPRYSSTYKFMGDGSHVKLFGNNCSAVGFGMTEKYTNMGKPAGVDMVGTLSLSEFNGNVDYNIMMSDFVENHSVETKKSLMEKMLEDMAKKRYA